MREDGLLKGCKRLLHIAPEPALLSALSGRTGLTCVSGDLVSRTADVRMDVCRLPFPDGAFEAVLCNHVLEHVPDDRSAIRELYRVLAHGGWACLQVPVDLRLHRTTEVLDRLAPEERERRYGQCDHVRQYGRDYPDRLRENGFRVAQIALETQRIPEQTAALGLMADDRIYIGEKG